MGKFETLSKALKTNNHPRTIKLKVEVRRRVLDAIGPEARVFDAFAGDGEMFRAVWSAAAGYVGCDLNWYRDDRLAFVADNRRVLRAVDLSQFQIFDLDAYGAPWEQALIVAARRRLKKGERIGFALTEGSGLSLKLGNLMPALAMLTGLRPTSQASERIHAGLNRYHDDLIGKALHGMAARMGGTLVQRWEAKRPERASMVYIGAVIEAR